VWVRLARAGCLAPDGLCRICAACRGPASHHRPDTRRRVYGGWCRAKSPEAVERRGGNDVGADRCDAPRVDRDVNWFTASANDRKSTARSSTFRSLVGGPAVVGRSTCCELLVCARCVLLRPDIA